MTIEGVGVGGLVELVPVLELGATGLVSLGVVLIATGRLVPARTVDRIVAARDEIIVQQRATIERQQSVIQVRDEQVGALVEQGQTSARALEALRRAGEGAG
ncbi:hypothetical protein [Streptomonospora wellingtoniae]|uniref:Holin n=1 Tax=Streptomonospora wellingtoniae TaxID=3075544 RepID=A0ABU2KUB2_9ACTN|nr:hypothetical protein [Streptomonospora sp. DSM 45055]MDT0302890.1 hypothetical protein [Streptomonospora sp. DSM 45055]